jgi:hypothetical protein
MQPFGKRGFRTKSSHAVSVRSRIKVSAYSARQALDRLEAVKPSASCALLVTHNQLASTFCLAKIISRSRVGPNHIGFFQPRAEQSACVSCDDLGDYYQEKAGQTACSTCPVNTARSVRQDVTAANKSSCQCIPGAAPIDGYPSLNTVDRFSVSVNVQATSTRRARPERSALLF